MAFWWYKSVFINIFFFFQNKIINSKYRFISKTYIEQFHKYFSFFHWNPYLKTDSANLLILFSVNNFHKRICRNFYVIFLCNASKQWCIIALGKTQKRRESKTIISQLKNRAYINVRLWSLWHDVAASKPFALAHC